MFNFKPKPRRSMSLDVDNNDCRDENDDEDKSVNVLLLNARRRFLVEFAADVRKYGIVEHKSNTSYLASFEMFKKKFFFIRNGWLGYIRTHNSRLESDIKEIREGTRFSHGVLLYPGLIVTVNGKEMHLNIPDDNLIESPVVKMRFTSSSQCQEWKACIDSECSTETFFQSAISSPFTSSVHKRFTKLLLSAGNQEYLKMFAHYNLNRDYHKLIKRVQQWCVLLPRDESNAETESNPEVFVDVLKVMVSSPFFRSFFFLFSPINENIPKNSSFSNETNVLKFIIQESKSDNNELKKVFLAAIRHPSSTKGKNHKFASKEDFEWNSNVSSTDYPYKFELSTAEIRLVFKEEAYVLPNKKSPYLMYLMIYLALRQGCIVDAKHFMSCLPADWLLSKFTAINPESKLSEESNHFIEILLDSKLSAESTELLADIFFDKKKVNDVFVRALLKLESLPTPSVLKILKKLVFQKCGSEDDYSNSLFSDNLINAPNTAVIIFDALAETAGTSNGFEFLRENAHAIRKVFAIVLKIEYAEKQDNQFQIVQTLAKHLKSGIESAESVIKKARQLLECIQYRKYILYSALRPNYSLFKTPHDANSVELSTKNKEPLRRMDTQFSKNTATVHIPVAVALHDAAEPTYHSVAHEFSKCHAVASYTEIIDSESNRSNDRASVMQVPSKFQNSLQVKQFHEFSIGEIVDMVTGYFDICTEFESDDFSEFVREAGEITFYVKCLHNDYNILSTIVDKAKKKYKISRDICKYLTDRYVFYDAGHFKIEVFKLLANTSFARKMPVEYTWLVSELLIAALYIPDEKYNYSKLGDEIEIAISWMNLDIDNAYQFASIIRRVAQYCEADVLSVVKNRLEQGAFVNRKEFNQLDFSNILQCAQAARSARKILNGTSGVGHDSLQTMFQYYLANQKPSVWLKLFKGAETIAYFIKYIDREDIDLAYSKIRAHNRSNDLFLKAIDASQTLLPTAIVNATDVVNMMKTSKNEGSSDDRVLEYIERLRSRALSEHDSSLQLLLEITAAWMKNRKEVIGIPMAPRNIQMIVLLSCSYWINKIFRSDSNQRTMLCQVGTGEGKSLIIAMAALYLYKVKGKKVHILENNSGLLEKDVSQFKAMFKDDFSIEIAEAVEHESEVGSSITYTLRGPIEQYYRNCISSQKSPFKDTVLIVDEVDDLIVDSNPNSTYVNVDSDTLDFTKCFDAILAGEGNPGVSLAVWKAAQGAASTGKSFRKGKDFCEIGGKYYFLDEKGRIQQQSYVPGLEFLGYADKDIEPKLQTRFYVQSLPHMFGQYEAILGFSGSLGSPSEKSFLLKNYRAFTCNIPPFLDTCRDIEKHPPQLKHVRVHDSEYLQMDDIVQLAISNFEKVPVLIICSKPSVAVKYYERIKDHIARHIKLPQSKTSDDFVQLFLELKPNTTENMDWVDIVEKATTVQSGGCRITITDTFGGRGHDFRVVEDEVDIYGGLYVIMSLIPESEREWIQWKGRTARNDCKGQYSVILCKNDSPLNQLSNFTTYQDQENAAVGSSDYSEELLPVLLQLADKKKLKTLNDLENEISSGKRANELCDQFYVKYGNPPGWPSTDNHRKLRDFLSEGIFSKEKIEEFRRLVRLQYRSQYN